MEKEWKEAIKLLNKIANGRSCCLTAEIWGNMSEPYSQTRYRACIVNGTVKGSGYCISAMAAVMELIPESVLKVR